MQKKYVLKLSFTALFLWWLASPAVALVYGYDGYSSSLGKTGVNAKGYEQYPIAHNFLGAYPGINEGAIVATREYQQYLAGDHGVGVHSKSYQSYPVSPLLINLEPHIKDARGAATP